MKSEYFAGSPENWDSPELNVMEDEPAVTLSLTKQIFLKEKIKMHAELGGDDLLNGFLLKIKTKDLGSKLTVDSRKHLQQSCLLGCRGRQKIIWQGSAPDGTAELLGSPIQ